MAIPYSGNSLQADKRKRMLNEIFFVSFYLVRTSFIVYICTQKTELLFFYSFILYVQVCFDRKMIRELNDTFINPLKTTTL